MICKKMIRQGKGRWEYYTPCKNTAKVDSEYCCEHTFEALQRRRKSAEKDRLRKAKERKKK